MSMKINIKPKDKDTKVRMPEFGGRYLAEDGESVMVSTYWTRRLRTGEVVEVKTSTKKQSGDKT
jgi:hypothetical protein